MYSRDEVLLQRCQNYLLVVVLCERPTSLRPYKSEGRGPQGELCDHFVVRCFNNGHGIIFARYEVKGFQLGTGIAEALLCRFEALGPVLDRLGTLCKLISEI